MFHRLTHFLKGHKSKGELCKVEGEQERSKNRTLRPDENSRLYCNAVAYSKNVYILYI